MREIGGYIELDTYTGNMLYNNGVKLNCGRNALAYLIKAKNIQHVLMPKFMCDSCNKVLRSNGVQIQYYSVGLDFKPVNLERGHGEWLYLVNFFGQLSNEYIKSLGCNIIVDNAQAYFNDPINGLDTIYTCRKFFGVPDGAVLYTDTYLQDLPRDESFDRMHFLLGRYERSASEFYSEYVENNHFFENEPIKKMSKLTENLLHGIDYKMVKDIRTTNFSYLHRRLSRINKLNLYIPEGAFMYPLYIENGAELRKKLQAIKIFVPTLWPAVFEICDESELEYIMAKNILPLPVDQRYTTIDMEYIVSEVLKCIN